MKSITIRICLCTLILLLPASVMMGQTSPPPQYDVDIVFLGLMAFDMSDAKAPVAIIPNVKNGYQELGDDGHMVAPHLSYILASLTELPEDHPLNSTHDFKAPAGGAEKYHYLDLNGEQIAVDEANVAGLNAPVSYQIDGCNTTCPGSTNHTALCWLSSLQDVDADPNLVKNDKYFNRTPPASSVTARAVLGYGKLEAHVTGLIIDQKLQAPKWEFRSPTGAGDSRLQPQALAQEIHWTFKAKELPFVLNLIGLNGGLRRLAFMPTQDTQGGHLMIIVGNTPQKDTGIIMAPISPTRDEHYSVYQRFISGNDAGIGKIPIPKTIKVSSVEVPDMCKESAYLFLPTLTAEQAVSTTQSDTNQKAQARKRQTQRANKSGASAHKTMGKAAAPAGDPPPDDVETAPGGLNCTGLRWQPPITTKR